MSLNIDAIKHPKLSCKLFRKFNVLLLFLSKVITLYSVETFIKVFKKFSILFSSEEGGDQRFLFFFEGNEFRKLLLLKFVTDKLDVLAEIADLGNFLLLGVC